MRKDMKFVVCAYALLALIAAFGAKAVVMPVNNYWMWITSQNYKKVVIFMVPTTEETYKIGLAAIASRVGMMSFIPSLLSVATGFAVQERILLYEGFPKSLPIAFHLVLAGVYVAFRRFRMYRIGYLATVGLHTGWNLYWVS